LIFIVMCEYVRKRGIAHSTIYTFIPMNNPYATVYQWTLGMDHRWSNYRSDYENYYGEHDLFDTSTNSR